MNVQPSETGHGARAAFRVNGWQADPAPNPPVRRGAKRASQLQMAPCVAAHMACQQGGQLVKRDLQQGLCDIGALFECVAKPLICEQDSLLVCGHV